MYASSVNSSWRWRWNQEFPVCVYWARPYTVGEEFTRYIADFGVLDPITGAFAVPLGGSFNVGWESSAERCSMTV